MIDLHMSAGTFIIDGGAKPYMIGTARVLLNRNGTLTYSKQVITGPICRVRLAWWLACPPLTR